MSNYNGFKPGGEIYLVYEKVDFRMCVNGLTAYIQETLKISPFSEACFIFCNRADDKLKIIEWDYNGFWMYYKRLDKGKFSWPVSSDDNKMVRISRDQYDWLMNGLSVDQRDGFKEVPASKVV